MIDGQLIIWKYLKPMLWVLVLGLSIKLLQGCSNPVYDIKTDKTTVVVELVDRVDNQGSYGMAVWSDDYKRCHVRVLKSIYPHCITHEIRHCFEGDFHAGRDSIADCYTK